MIFHASLPAGIRESFGVTYPLTYKFTVISRPDNVQVSTRRPRQGTFQNLQTLTRPFDGVQGFRYDPQSGDLFVSCSFDPDAYDGRTYIDIRDGLGGNVSASFVGVTSYYDDRSAAVVVTFDDWCGDSLYHESFVKACQLVRARSMWGSMGINSQGIPSESRSGLSSAQWEDTQAQIDLGYVEIVNHGRTHLRASDNEAQMHANVLGGEQDIKDNVTLPWQSRVGTDQFVLGWIDPYGASSLTLRQKLSESKTLSQRGNIDAAEIAWRAFDTTLDIFERAWFTESFDNAFDTTSFDNAVNGGGIFHAACHPYLNGTEGQWADWDHDLDNPAGSLQQALDYVSGDPDIWYCGWGHLYAYRMAALNVVVRPTDSFVIRAGVPVALDAVVVNDSGFLPTQRVR